jgi:cytochrome P450
MARPGGFLRRLHQRFGDPATIRTYWTREPMVLFSSPDAVRELFRLDPSIAPAGQSWEFLRPFAGPHSILLLDGEEHLRERRLLQVPSTASACAPWHRRWPTWRRRSSPTGRGGLSRSSG